MASVGYFEAWSRWVDGDAGLRDAELWGLRILWWGRVGKFAAFLAGMTLVMDIIGPERLRQFSERYMRRHQVRRGFTWMVGVAAAAGVFLVWAVFFPGTVRVLGVDLITVSSTGVTAVTAAIALAVSLVLLAPVLLNVLRRILIHVFENDALARTTQIDSLVLFTAGFHFDMLAS
jgi:hypothetical protein